VLGEVLTWFGVATAAAFAWALYIFGDNQPKRDRVKVEENKSDE
jgi:hypothetical protein